MHRIRPRQTHGCKDARPPVSTTTTCTHPLKHACPHVSAQARPCARTNAHTHIPMHANSGMHQLPLARKYTQPQACARHARTRACAHARTHVQTRSHARTDVRMRACTRACVHARTRALTYARARARARTDTVARTHAQMCTRTRTHVHTHACTHTHTHARSHAQTVHACAQSWAPQQIAKAQQVADPLLTLW